MSPWLRELNGRFFRQKILCQGMSDRKDEVTQC